MSNKSYLYATDVIPGSGNAGDGSMIGLSEWSNGIPLSYQLLVSGSPAACRSSIWESEEDTAIVGDYAQGVARLAAFLQRIDVPSAQPLIDETLRFLDDKQNVKKYIVLECGEIFDYNDEPHEDQNSDLLEEIQNLDDEIEQALAEVLPAPTARPTPQTWVGRLFGKKAEPVEIPDISDDVAQLGLGEWSNALYVDLSSNVKI